MEQYFRLHQYQYCIIIVKFNYTIPKINIKKINQYLEYSTAFKCGILIKQILNQQIEFENNESKRTYAHHVLFQIFCVKRLIDQILNIQTSILSIDIIGQSKQYLLFYENTYFYNMKFPHKDTNANINQLCGLDENYPGLYRILDIGCIMSKWYNKKIHIFLNSQCEY